MFDKVKAFAFDIDGVFTDGSILAVPDGDLLRVFNAKDTFAVRMAVDAGYPVAIITGGCSNSIIHRAKTMGIPDSDIYLLSRDKVTDIELFCSRHSLSLEQVLFMGDDLPDLSALEACGLPACPSDAVPEVKEASKYICSASGGKGAVREVIEKVLKPRDEWHFDRKAPFNANYPDEIMALANGKGRFV